MSAEALDAFIHHMDRTPNSGVTMCHEQGKTAVSLSDDGEYQKVWGQEAMAAFAWPSESLDARSGGAPQSVGSTSMASTV